MEHNIHPITRRSFLSLTALAAVNLMLPRRLPTTPDIDDDLLPPPKDYGRVISWQQAIRIVPDPGAKIIRWIGRDESVRLYAQLLGVAPWESNPTWYLVDGGYVHSGYIQPVDTTPNPEVIREVEPPGFWAEVCLPYAQGSWSAGGGYARRLYFETVYRVIGAQEAADGTWWYQLADGITYGSPGLWVPAESMRRLTPEVVTPLSPGRTDKWIQITIDTETLVCFEGDTPVFTTRTGSGVWGTPTPRGEFTVIHKRFTRRMVGDDYDLPGVPFPVYITRNGVAVHGTYWHNDYGRRHSHGCVNIASQAARWIFRWVDPVADYVETTVIAEANTGTPVVVV